MAKTLISDVIVPEIFNNYLIERTAERSALFRSGIISNNPNLDALANSGGNMINMPYWEDLTGDDEILSDVTALTVGKITGSKDIARLHMRGKAWSTNDLAKALSGDDPMNTIVNLAADFWARKMQTLLINTLGGALSATNIGDNAYDITGESTDTISASTLQDAFQRLGDAKDRLAAIAMHSDTQTLLAKNDLIDTIRDSQGRIMFNTYMDKMIIVDDGLPVDGTDYTTYIFGEGAIGYGNGNAPVPVETDRDSLAGDDLLITRRHFLLHPRGIKWNEASVAGKSPTNAEVALAANWTRVYENKNIRIVQFKHKLA